MSKTVTSNTSSTIERQIETDLQSHLTDTFTVNAIRGGQLVPVSWGDLTPAERRAAQANMFHLYGQEV